MNGTAFTLYRKRLLNIFVINILLSFSTTSTADSYWTCTDGDWSDSSCWSSGATPFLMDDVFLTQSDSIDRTVTYTSPLNTTRLTYLNIDSTGSGAFTLNQSQGTIDSYITYLGLDGTGTYTLQNGTYDTTYMFIGQNSGSHGTFNLIDGNLITGPLAIGRAGDGTFNQSGGLTSATNISVGSSLGGNGSYTLSGTGSINTGNITIGNRSTGTFTQNGGTNTISNQLSIGYSGNGTYILNSGSLNVGDSVHDDEYVGANNGIGKFTQNAGTHNVSGEQILWGASSTYELTSGNLSSNGLNIRASTGNFVQSGGTNTVNGDISIGYGSTSSTNSYTLSDGTLIISGDIKRTSGGESILNLNGGTLHVNNVEVDTLNIASTSESEFTYKLESGKTLTANTINADTEGAQFDFTGGTLSVDAFNGILTNKGGVLAQGNSLGITTINGDYTQELNGVFDVEIGGLLRGYEYDALDVTGVVNLGGTLNVNYYDFGWDGIFDASLGDTFDILTADVLIGEFDLLTLAMLGDDLEWKLDYLIDFNGTTDYLRLSVVSAVPLPATVWLFTSGIIGLIGVARRKARS